MERVIEKLDLDQCSDKLATSERMLEWFNSFPDNMNMQRYAVNHMQLIALLRPRLEELKKEVREMDKIRGHTQRPTDSVQVRWRRCMGRERSPEAITRTK